MENIKIRLQELKEHLARTFTFETNSLTLIMYLHLIEDVVADSDYNILAKEELVCEYMNECVEHVDYDKLSNLCKEKYNAFYMFSRIGLREITLDQFKNIKSKLNNEETKNKSYKVSELPNEYETKILRDLYESLFNKTLGVNCMNVEVKPDEKTSSITLDIKYKENKLNRKKEKIKEKLK